MSDQDAPDRQKEEVDTASAGLPPRGTPGIDGEDALLRTAMGLPTTESKE
ncbi:MAG: hypothetical protein ACYCXR_03170 [Coriobacteriia bacterium]